MEKKNLNIWFENNYSISLFFMLGPSLQFSLFT